MNSNLTIDDSLTEFLSSARSKLTADSVGSVPVLQFLSYGKDGWSKFGPWGTSGNLTAIGSELGSVSDGSYFNNTGSFTDSAGASVAISAKASAIYFYGVTGFKPGYITVYINGDLVMSTLAVNVSDFFRLREGSSREQGTNTIDARVPVLYSTITSATLLKYVTGLFVGNKHHLE